MVYVSRRNKDRSRLGFTLIEIVIAIAIVGLMVAVVGPAVFKFLGFGKRSAVDATINGYKTAILQYNITTNTFPKTLEDLVRRPSDETTAKKWRGPYIDELQPTDPWGNPYVYRATGNPQKPYELYSYGENGTEATKEEWIGVTPK
jgi:general secretion pathway protein G